MHPEVLRDACGLRKGQLEGYVGGELDLSALAAFVGIDEILGVVHFILLLCGRNLFRRQSRAAAQTEVAADLEIVGQCRQSRATAQIEVAADLEIVWQCRQSRAT